MSQKVPYSDIGTPAFEVLDTYLQNFLFVGSDPAARTFGGFQFEENQVLARNTVVGLNTRHKIVPATVASDATTYFVPNVAIVAGGTGGTNGAAVVTGTTGTGTKFQANVTIAGGVITAINSMAVEGSYTVAPSVPTVEPVTGGGLTGATLKLTVETLVTPTVGIQAIGVTTEAITTLVGDDLRGVPLWYSGCFDINALVWDSSFTSESDKYRAFQGAPTPTQVLVKKRSSDA